MLLRDQGLTCVISWARRTWARTETWWWRWQKYDFIWSVIEIDDRLAVGDVIRYETLYDDLDRICRRLGIGFDRAVFPRERTTERPSRDGAKVPYQEVIPSTALVAEIARFFDRTLT